ncbi:MAG: Omp28-related outer membrane protein [Bacteroidia bacterium]|jgi:hypothetical protein|nr:Omp28-related outer membrane protein [Bacteroidia bacterium]
MKKQLFTLFAAFLLGGALMAQLPVSTTPQNKKAILEEFTGVKCTWCPAGHVIANSIKAADPNNVIIINIHSGSFANVNPGEPDFKTPEGNAIDAMPGMGITGYPAGTMNRRVLSGSVMAGSRSLWTGWANTVKSEAAYCNVALQGTLDPVTRVLTVDVEVYYTANSPVGTNSLNVFLLESKIPGPQTNASNANLGNYTADGKYLHNHALRKALTPTFGMTIPNTTMGTLFTTQLTYTIPATYGAAGKTTVPNLGNLELVGFVSQTDRNHINGAEGPIYFLNDAEAVSASVPSFTCGNSIEPMVTVKNAGITTITDMTITPAIDGTAGTPVIWNGSLATNASTTISMGALSAATGGGHVFTYTISGISGSDFYTVNNSASAPFFMVSNYQSSPIAEDFASVSFPPASWGMVNANNGAGWSRISSVGAYAILPLGSMKYDFFSNTVVGDADEMMLPPIDLDGANTPILTFDIAKANRNGKNDMLEVMVSTDCGANWVTVYSKSGPALSVWPTAINSSYLPVTAAEWRTDTVALTGFNVPELLVKFVATNDNGNNMFLDNINLSQSNPVGINTYGMINYLVDVYPNPSNGETNVLINAIHASAATVKVVNSIGQVVYTSSQALAQGENNIKLDASQFAHGMYSIIIESKHGKVVKKLTVAD